MTEHGPQKENHEFSDAEVISHNIDMLHKQLSYSAMNSTMVDGPTYIHAYVDQYGRILEFSTTINYESEENVPNIALAIINKVNTQGKPRLRVTDIEPMDPNDGLISFDDIEESWRQKSEPKFDLPDKALARLRESIDEWNAVEEITE